MSVKKNFHSEYNFEFNLNSTGGNLLILISLHGSINAFSVFYEVNLFPPLLEEDLWLIIWILLAIISIIKLRQKNKYFNKINRE